MSTEDVASKQGTLGELKLVGKVRKPFICADCNKAVLIGNSCYDQSDYRGPGFFPEKIRICVDCGEIKMKGGTTVKKKPVKAPKKRRLKTLLWIQKMDAEKTQNTQSLMEVVFGSVGKRLQSLELCTVKAVGD